MTTNRRYDVIVIGSGIGGLTAALTAANAGLGVLVLEAGKQFGGYTNPFKRGKYSFDPGLHYIGECGPGQQLTRILEKLGLADEITFRELSPDGFDRLVFPGYEVAMPRGAERYHDRLERDFPHERDGLAKFFATLTSFRSAVAAMVAIRGPASIVAVAPHAPFFLRYGRATFSELIDPMIRDPLLRAVLSAQGGDYGLPPGRASAMIGLGVLDHYLGGAYFPRGGSRAIRDGFVKAIERKGGVMLRNHAVTRVVIEGDRVTGVRCANGEAFEARTVISNADATFTYRELIGPERLPFLLRRRTQAMRPSIASLCLFLGTSLDVAAAGMTDANIWHYSSVDIDSAYRPIREGRFAPDDFFFLSSPSLKDPDAVDKAPAGHHTLELVTLAPFEPFAKWAGMKTMKRGPDYLALKAELTDRLLGCVERYIPGIRDHLTVAELGTPATNLTYAAAPLGAIYGPEQTPDQMGPWRYGMKGAIPGLFLCGSSTLGAGIVPGAVSGFSAGKMAVAAVRA
jgi:all-trans-retinol 13,14-reductase